MAALASSIQAEVLEAADPSEIVKSKPTAFQYSPDSNAERLERANPTVNGSVPALEPAAAVIEHEELEASSTVLIRREERGRERAERGRNGRPGSFHVSSRTDFTLTDTFRVSGKACTVTLDEESISWAPRKGGQFKKESLYLSDIFAVVSETPGKSKHSQDSSLDSHPTTFTLHALRSCAGSVGQLVKVVFKCSKSDTCQMWAQQIHHQMQNFGNRPRRLYVIVNPVSGTGAAPKVWAKVQSLFQLAQINTEVVYTQRKNFARELIQTLDLAEYDGIIVVGGDGTFNEVLNGLLVQTQQQSGVNMRRSRFVPVTPYIRLGIIPAGFHNSIARSILGGKCPMVTAAQIMLGCSTPLDICSVSHNGQLLLFSAGPMFYGFWSDTALFSQDFSWLGAWRLNIAILRTIMASRFFEGELSFVPVEDSEAVRKSRERCFNRCRKCSDFDSSLDSPGATNEKGASVMASYSEVDRVDDGEWKTITGHFSSIIACPHMCVSRQAPRGMSPWGHLGNGCVDLIMLSQCSRMSHARWLLRQRKGGSQFDLPDVHIHRVKEFRFREILKPTGSSPNDHEGAMASVENLVQEVDDDEVTNSMASRGPQQQGERAGPGVAMPTSRWNVDGDELPRADLDVRVHRHLITVFARGVEPLESTSNSSSGISIDRTDQDELLPDS